MDENPIRPFVRGAFAGLAASGAAATLLIAAACSCAPDPSDADRRHDGRAHDTAVAAARIAEVSIQSRPAGALVLAPQQDAYGEWRCRLGRTPTRVLVPADGRKIKVVLHRLEFRDLVLHLDPARQPSLEVWLEHRPFPFEDIPMPCSGGGKGCRATKIIPPTCRMLTDDEIFLEKELDELIDPPCQQDWHLRAEYKEQMTSW